MNSLTDDKFWELLGKQLSGEASAEELKDLEILIKDFRLKTLADTFSALWLQNAPINDAEALHALDQHIERMKEKGIESDDPFNKHPVLPTSETSGKKKYIRRWLLPVSGLIALLLGFVLWRNFSVISNKKANTVQPVSKVTTRPGSRTHLQLPDGSSVWLNASSNLTYDENFGKELREVTLTGEAFFDVVKDAGRPFIIHTKAIDVKVLGTQFNVKAYPDEQITEASLIRGSIELTVKNKDHDKYMLKPNEKIVISNDVLKEEPSVKLKDQPKISLAPQKLNYSPDSTVIETSWVENKLIFQEKETFSEVAVKMERWYGVHIIFTNEEVAKLRPFGSFTTETITQALDAFKEFIKFSYKMNGNEIIISP